MPDDLLKLFARNLKTYREIEGISQAKLAELAGISLNFVSLIEVGRKFLGPDKIGGPGAALPIKPFHLFIDVEEEAPDPVVNKLVARRFLADLANQVKMFSDGYFKE